MESWPILPSFPLRMPQQPLKFQIYQVHLFHLVSFFDVDVCFERLNFCTSVYIMTIYHQQYLQFSSYHLLHLLNIPHYSLMQSMIETSAAIPVTKIAFTQILNLLSLAMVTVLNAIFSSLLNLHLV